MDLNIKECFKQNFNFLTEYLHFNKTPTYDNLLKSYLKSDNKQLFILEYLDNSESAIEQHRLDMITFYSYIVHHYHSIGKDEEISKYLVVSIVLKPLLLNINFYLKKLESFQIGKDYDDFKISDLNISSYFRLNTFIKLNLIIIFSILLFSKRIEIVNYLKNELGDYLEDTIYNILKLTSSHKFLPINSVLSVYYILIDTTLTECSSSSILTQRTKSKRFIMNDEFLEDQMKKLEEEKVPLYFFDYINNDKFIEKFYRKNILKKEERIFISSLLNILLSLTDNISIYLTSGIGSLFSLKCVSNEALLLKIIKYEKEERTKINFENFLALISYIESKYTTNTDLINDLFSKFLSISIIISTYSFIVSTLKKWNTIQFLCLSTLMADTNGLLVFLKALNIDIKNLIIKIDEQSLYEKSILISTIEKTIFSNMKMLYKIFDGKDEYIYKFLYEFKIYLILKKIMNAFTNNDIKRYCLKLLKIQLKYFDKNQKAEHMNMIANIYLYLKPDSTNDNYLKFKKRENGPFKNFDEKYSLDDYKKFYNDFNTFHYLKYYNNHNMIQAFYLQKYSSVYCRLLDMIKLKSE